MTKLRSLFIAGLCVWAYAAALPAQTDETANYLLKNGSVDDPEDPLNHWS